MENQLKTLVHDLASGDAMILNIDRIKEANDWVIVDGDRNVVENQHDGEDVQDDGGGEGGGGDDGGGDGGGGFHSFNVSAFRNDGMGMAGSSVRDLLRLRNKVITRTL
jgi:hypothetical protein